MLKQRDISIDIIKFFAAILITNSHMGDLYVQGKALATGGAIGDALFFFCSGYTLFLGQERPFFNWYKRRINRIFPTIIMWGLFECLFFGIHDDFAHVLVNDSRWFITCIMIYYIFLYFVRKYLTSKLSIAFGISIILSIVAYLFVDNHLDNIYGTNGFRQVFFFMFMLLGAAIGKNRQSKLFSAGKDLLLAVVFLMLYYGIQFLYPRMCLGELQLLSIVALLLFCYFFWKVCNCEWLGRLYHSKVVGFIIQFVGGLCLEIYVVQHALFTTSMNHLFPLNLLIMFVIILVMAYILRCAARFFVQTFNKEDYDWKEMVKLV